MGLIRAVVTRNERQMDRLLGIKSDAPEPPVADTRLRQQRPRRRQHARRDAQEGDVGRQRDTRAPKGQSLMPTYSPRRIRVVREWIATSNAEWIAYLSHMVRGRWKHHSSVRGGGSPATAVARAAERHPDFFAPEHHVAITIERDDTVEQARRAHESYFGSSY
jgi:hypothetical protein